MSDATDPAGLHERPADLLSELIAFDTTNPPGDERECVEWVADLLDAYGVDSETFARDPERPNLIARLPGGDAPALMLYGHVDVVPTTGQDWTHPPFEGVVEDGYVWGRGALDMKGGVAMMLSAFLRAAAEDAEPAGDLVLCVLADEEAGGDDGAGYMVEEHADQFRDVEYALGEFGGFSTGIAGERFYPIQTNEKQVCWLEATFRGRGGHGSSARFDTAMGDMGRAVAALTESRLPVHVTPTVEAMAGAMADGLDGEMAEQVRALLDPERTDAVLDEHDEIAELFDPILHNTANPTVVEGGDKTNVIPAEVTVELDCRILPGQTREDLERELGEILPDDVDVEFEAVAYDPSAADADADMGMFDLLAGVIEDADPGATAIPYMLSGGTDARHLAKIGVQSYGFTPMKLPPDFGFMEFVHAADERIPVETVEFGADAMYEAVERYER